MELNTFVDEQKYQQIMQDLLARARKKGATQAEAALTASIGLNVSVRMQSVDTLEFNRDKALGLTVYIGKQKGSASTTDLSENSLEATVEAAINLAKLMEPDEFSGLAEKTDLAQAIPSLALYHPWDLSVSQAIEMAQATEQFALGFDKQISNSDGVAVNSGQSFYMYGNTHGFLGAYPASRHGLSCSVIAHRGSEMERDYAYTVSRKAALLDSAQHIGQQAAQRTIARLGAHKLSTRRVPVLIHAELAAGFLNNFIGAISGGRLFRRSSFLLDSRYKQIFPDWFEMTEQPHIPMGLASAPFDGDGVKTSEKDFVREGVVQNYVLSAYSARKLKLPNTGNSGGVHNVLVKSTGENYADLIKKMHKGLLVTELMGQGVNLVTGDYSRGASGFWVENGEIQHAVHEITIAGNLSTLFKQIVAIGEDRDLRKGIQTGSILIEEMMVAGS